MVEFIIETADTKLVVYSQTDPPPADATNELIDEWIAVTAAIAASDPRSMDQEERQTNDPKKKRKTINQWK
jgi:hypothetical protein